MYIIYILWMSKSELGKPGGPIEVVILLTEDIFLMSDYLVSLVMPYPAFSFATAFVCLWSQLLPHPQKWLLMFRPVWCLELVFLSLYASSRPVFTWLKRREKDCAWNMICSCVLLSLPLFFPSHSSIPSKPSLNILSIMFRISKQKNVGGVTSLF